MLKKLFTLFILIAFCSNYAVFAVDSETKMNAFKNVEEDADPTYDKLSTIERLYNTPGNAESGNVLYQAGYSHFAGRGAVNTSAGKYDSSYKLSIGERINVLSYGDSVDVISLSGSNLIVPIRATEVGSNGAIFIPGIGPIKADGRTLGEVEKEANSMAKKKYSNLTIKLQIPPGNGFSVFVYGEVNRPGKVYIGNNSSVFDVLMAAGGVKKTGTLRNIKYNNKSIDLYNTLFLGNDNGIILKANDKIYVDKIKNTMAIRNGVISPGIYEFKTGETFGDIIKYAGDLLVTTEKSAVTVISFEKGMGQKTARDIPYSDIKVAKISNGDYLQFRALYNNAENLVTLRGNIKHPAIYAYKEGMRLSDILKSEDELKEETFVYQAVIRRVSGGGNTIETVPIYLKEFFAGMNDPILQPRDIITIYKNTNTDFVDVYGCINTPKHVPYKEKMVLSDIMSDIQFIESDVKSIEENQKDSEENNVEPVVQNGENVKIKASTGNDNKLIPAERIAVEITDKEGTNVRTYYLYDVMINSDKMKNISINPEDKIFFRTLRENEVMKTIKISGFVKKPGVYSFIKGQCLTDVIKMAGGLDEDADLRGIVFTRSNLREQQVSTAIKNNQKDIKLISGMLASGYKQEASDQHSKLTLIEQLQEDAEAIKRQYNGQISLNIKSNDLTKINKMYDICIQDGDDIYIPRKANYVTVIGEVYNEQAFVYTKGANVKKYIKQVGGYTPNANRFRLYKVGVNGKAEKISMGTKVEAGDTIIVPRKIAGNDWLTPVTHTLQSIAYVFFMCFAVTRWK